ncbi:MAG TPA: peptidylprolyl isomerase [Thermomicrobiales bacterium]|nr:peptidylprolyl isomerase [Thermomicrobiales bacterium]
MSESKANYRSAPHEMSIDPSTPYTATITTSMGVLKAELYADDAPNTVNNFVNLARDGYFDGTPFHRIVAGFVVQGGDPTGTGTGGPGYRFADELGGTRDYELGTLAMANAGPNTNGSQFFICLDDLRGKLPKNYTIFGKVTEGLDFVTAMGRVETLRSRSGEKSQPAKPVTLESVTIDGK